MYFFKKLIKLNKENEVKMKYIKKIFKNIE